MKKLLLLFSTLLLSFSIFGQCPPSGTVLSTQTAIDNFPATCVNFSGVLIIEDDNDGFDNIQNLNGLANLSTVSSDLIIRNNVALTDISGLNSLMSTGTRLEIRDNDALTTLNGLNSLSTVGTDLQITGNNLLADISGLNSLTSTGNQLNIINNDALTTLNGLNSLSTVGTDVNIIGNDVLVICNALFRLLDGVNDASPDYGLPVPDVGANINISNNGAGGGCNNISEILAAGPPAIPTMSQWMLFLSGLLVFTVALVGIFNFKKVRTV